MNGSIVFLHGVGQHGNGLQLDRADGSPPDWLSPLNQHLARLPIGAISADRILTPTYSDLLDRKAPGALDTAFSALAPWPTRGGNRREFEERQRRLENRIRGGRSSGGGTLLRAAAKGAPRTTLKIARRLPSREGRYVLGQVHAYRSSISTREAIRERVRAAVIQASSGGGRP